MSLNNSNTKTPYIFSKLSPVKTTIVYDTYWKFAAERQNIFFKRIKNKYPPWTKDPILQKYKFTNAYRASDRVSQYLIKNIIYKGNQTPREIFFRIILFKTFNKIETWEILKNELKDIFYSEYSFERYCKILKKAININKSIYSAAYIMSSGKNYFGFKKKYKNHLKLFKLMMNDKLPDKIIKLRSMKELFLLLRSYPTIGNFLAYQYCIDINYSNIINFSEMEFVVPGPGAMDGIRKCFSDLGGLNEVEIIKLVTERQEIEFERLELDFKNLWGRPLQLIDCQNLFCEVGKYSRIIHPEFKGLSRRTKIKQKFKINLSPIDYWYPPNWKINKYIKNTKIRNNLAPISKRKKIC